MKPNKQQFVTIRLLMLHCATSMWRPFGICGERKVPYHNGMVPTLDVLHENTHQYAIDRECHAGDFLAVFTYDDGSVQVYAFTVREVSVPEFIASRTY